MNTLDIVGQIGIIRGRMLDEIAKGEGDTVAIGSIAGAALTLAETALIDLHRIADSLEQLSSCAVAQDGYEPEAKRFQTSMTTG